MNTLLVTMMKECSAVYSNVVCPSLLGCLRGGRPSEGLLGTKADDDNFDYCASIYFKLSWTSYCANKLQNMFANRTENRVILCWVFFQRWYKTSLTSWAPARLGQGGQGRHRLEGGGNLLQDGMGQKVEDFIRGPSRPKKDEPLSKRECNQFVLGVRVCNKAFQENMLLPRW